MTDATAVLTAEISANPQKLIEGFQKADQTTGAWAQAAARHMQTAQASFNGVDFTVVTSKAKAEQLKLIELQHQLDVARAAGSKKTVEALTEEIVLLGKVRQLRAAGLSGPDAMSAAKASLQGVAAARAEAEAAEAAAKRRERLIGNPGEAAERALGRVRLGVIDAGSEKVPLLASSLESLGIAGVAAAAGLAAAAAGAEAVRKSMEFAEDVERTSKSLGVSTTYLQAFDDASIATSIGQDKARESLQQFNDVFGKYSAGLASGKTAKFLDALGFTPESARQLGDVGGALDKTLVQLAKLANPQQRASLATQLGLANFLPILAEGTEGVEKFMAASREAQTNGSVVSPEAIAQAAEMNDKVEELTHRIGVEFKAAFIDAAPAVLKVAEFIERCTNELAHFLEDLPAAIRGIQDFTGALGKDADPNKQDLLDKGDTLLQRFAKGGVGHFLDLDNHLERGAFGSAVQTGKTDKLRDGINGLLRGDKQDFSAEQTTPFAPGVDLSPAKKPKKAKRGPADETADFDKSAVDAADEASKGVSEALAALTKNIQAHADAEKDAIDVEADEKLKDLSAQEVKIRGAKNDAHKADQLALIQAAQADTLTAAAAKKDLIDRQAQQAQDAADLAAAQQLEAYQDQILTARASMAKSAQARAELELEAAQDARRRATAQRVQEDRAAVVNGSMTQDAADADIAGRRASDSAETVADRTRQQRQINPLYARANPTTSVADDLQGLEAKGLDNVTDTLAKIVTNSGDAKAAFHDLVTSMISDLVKLGLQREFEQPIANFLFGASPTNNLGNLGNTGGSASVGAIATSGLSALLGLPGHASGSDSFGGLTRLNEQGPEGVAFLPDNTQIIPNATLRGLAALTPDKLGGGSQTVNHTIKIDLTGANGDETIRQIAHQAAALGTLQAIATSRSDQARAAQAQRNSTSGF